MGSEQDKKKHEEAYRRGVEDAKKSGVLGDIFQGLGDVVTTIVPSTKEQQSYQKGWQDQKSGKNK